MKKREFLQLAKVYNPKKHGIGGYFLSEKLDGMRAYWDGGISRGNLTSEIPWANTYKDFRRVDPVYATGLWSRYGKPIYAPEWWLDKLPDIGLDGELYLGPGTFQELMSIVKVFEPGPEWDRVKFYIFDMPSDTMIFEDGRINDNWIISGSNRIVRIPALPYYIVKKELEKLENFVPQEQLPPQTSKAIKIIEEKLSEVNEGLILRNPNTSWVPKRTNNLLKVKKYIYGEAEIVGYIWGKGKLENLMGAMIVLWKDKLFELSGFTEEERIIQGPGTREPGKTVTMNCNAKYFIRGETVNFKYRELSNNGIPKEATYFRDMGRY
jgi:DNA ligase 1